MTPAELLRAHLDLCPLVAIVRGVRPGEAEAIGRAIVDAGIGIIEVPLNSPDPFASIGALADTLGDRALIGAGTVLDAEQVREVEQAGGRLIVSPDTNATVIGATISAGLISCPGYLTPTEAFSALRAGAHGLKLFPAEAASPAALKAQLAVLPRDIPIIVVGGVKPETMQPWREAGAAGFGLGGGLYVAGQSAEDTHAKARAYVSALAPK